VITSPVGGLRSRRRRPRTTAGPAPRYSLFRPASPDALGKARHWRCRIRTDPGQRSPRSTGWQNRGRSSPPAQWPRDQRFLGTPSGTRRGRKPFGGAATHRIEGIDALGADKHVWAHTAPPVSGRVTACVDPRRDAAGQVHAQLLDVLSKAGRLGKATLTGSGTRGAAFTAGIKAASLHPFPAYANAIPDERPEAITVLDAFHVLKLGSATVDQVHRTVQQETLTQWCRRPVRSLRSHGYRRLKTTEEQSWPTSTSSVPQWFHRGYLRRYRNQPTNHPRFRKFTNYNSYAYMPPASTAPTESNRPIVL
jgi:hypothetical protein